jgi:tetratricopeptide (TPR) repeat protein
MEREVNRGKALYDHGLSARALEAFIDISNSADARAEDRSEALYYLGQIAFDAGNYAVAFDDWDRVAREYPASNRASELKTNLAQLRNIFLKVSDASVSSSVARSYLHNGDFWSGSDRMFTIDNSWLPNVELAIEWYDRVIAEFPKSEAAEMAFQRKLFSLLGWKGIGMYASSYGLKADFNKYMPLLLSTFADFEKQFPKSAYLQGFRYQIAQAYWIHRDWANTRSWLTRVVQNGDAKSFYVQTAKARLAKVEH